MDNKAIIRKFYEDIITNCKYDEIRDYISDQCVVRVGEQIVPIGVEGMVEHVKATKQTYPDYTMKILRQFEDEDTVISEFIMSGSHEGVFLGITPTHKVISITGVDIDKVVNGKIVKHGGAANTFEAFYENHLIETV